MAASLPNLYNDSWSISLKGDRLVEVQSKRIFSNAKATPLVRGLVTGFSPRSAHRMRDYLVSAVVDYKVMVTLTVPSWASFAGEPLFVKAKFRSWVCKIGRYLGARRGESFPPHESLFWFMEFTQAGIVHFHVFLTSFIAKEYVAVSWYDSCGTGDSRHLLAGTRTEALKSGRDGMSSYAWKYASKNVQKNLPSNILAAGRWWGISGCRKVVEAAISHIGPYPREGTDVFVLLKGFWWAIEGLLQAEKGRLLPSSSDYPGVSCYCFFGFSTRLEIRAVLRELGRDLRAKKSLQAGPAMDFWLSQESLECL